jgi:hypothetical protein
MRIKAMLATHDLPEESMPWMVEARSVFDELVIFIDEKRVTPGTPTRAKEVASRVHYHKADTWYEWDLASMTRACESDWVFIIERDEQLSPEWHQDSWRRILKTTELTHFWCPRRWVLPSGRYINHDPWWPDFQLRLLRSDLDGTIFPKMLHETTYVPGAGGCFANLAIHHHVLWLSSRADREKRVRYYEQLRPGGALGHYYLFEDYELPHDPLPKPSKLDATHEINRMEKLPREKIARISLQIDVVPREVQVSALFWLNAKVANATNETLYSVAPYPVGLAYNGLEKTTRRVVWFEGNRSGLFPGLKADNSEQYPMRIIAPSQPGEYILQTTMVQDGVCWFEDVTPPVLREFCVSVVSETRPNGTSLRP